MERFHCANDIMALRNYAVAHLRGNFGDNLVFQENALISDLMTILKNFSGSLRIIGRTFDF